MRNGFIEISEEQGRALDAAKRAVSETREYSIIKRTSSGTFLAPRYLYSNGPAPSIKNASYPPELRLKDHQVIPVESVVDALSRHSGALLQAPCGSGKTVMALSVAARLGVKNVVILVDQVNIAVQWQNSIAAVLKEPSEIFCSEYKSLTDASVRGTGFRIIVAQSLMRHTFSDNPITCEMLIVDEAHVFSAPAFLTSMFNLDFCFSLALTATPDRKDKLEWVFQAVLGKTVVKANKPRNDALVNIVTVTLPTQIYSEDYYMWWCRKVKKTTWAAACASCEHYNSYPNCGGVTRPQGKPRLMMAGLIRRVVFDPAYMAFTKDTLASFYKNGRQALIFSHLKEHLRALYAFAVEAFGNEACGLYIGGATAADKKNRQEAMARPLTFCTYSIANKALDVPHKDTAFFTSPVSDIRQAKGRIERDVPGKNRPVIIDPVISDVGLFIAMAKKRQKTYRETHSTITYVNRDYSSNQKHQQHRADPAKKGN